MLHNNIIIKSLSYFLFLLGSILLFACKDKPRTQRLVSVSILPQKYFTEKIAGDYLEVNVLIPPGMNPATSDLSTGQLKKLYDSELCFTIGYLPFELTHLYPVLENRKGIQVINHSAQLELLEGSCSHTHTDGQVPHGVDPHIWLSPAYAKTIATTIYEVLSEKYPDQQKNFQENYSSLVQDIDSIAHKARRVLQNKQNKVFLIYHPALTYFAADYGLEQYSIEDEGKEPNPAHLKKIIDLSRQKDIHIIFIQNQFDVNNAVSIAREINGKVISIDPLAEDWTTEMNRLIDILDENLKDQ